MNLLVITNLFPNPVEPLRSTFNERQLTALANTSTLVVISPISWITKLRYCARGSLEKVNACRTWNGIPVHYPTYYYLPKIIAWPRGLTMAASILWRCIRSSRDNRSNVIFATWAFPDGFAAVTVGRLIGLPVVIKVHGSDVESLGVKGLARRMSLWGLVRASKVISVSSYLKEKLIEHGIAREKLAVVYNGVDAELFSMQDQITSRNELGLDPGRKTILYVGNLKSDKGLLDLIHAISHETCRRLNPYLVIIGGGPLKYKLEQQVKALAIEGNVQLLGRKSPAEIAKWMNAADCLCLPSHHEGIPNVILEALSCGLPILATRVGGIPEIVNAANGVLIHPQQPGELAEGIVHILGRRWDRSAVRSSSPAKSRAESAATLEQELMASIG